MQSIQPISNAAVPATNGSGTGAAASAGSGNGFGSMLVQVLGSNGSSNGVSGSLPDLKQLLAGLLGTDTLNGLTEGDGTDMDWTALLGKLSSENDLLDKLLQSGEGQEWMLQAASLLQALQQLPQNLMAQSGSEENGMNAEDQAGPVTLQQAQGILQAFSQASAGQSGQIFIGQLQEKLGGLIMSMPELQQLLKDAGADKTMETGTSRAHASKGNKDLTPEVEDGLAGTVQVTKTPSVVNRLEVLAAKTMPVGYLNGIQADDGSRAQEAVSLSDKANDDNLLPFPISQELAKLVNQQSDVPVEGTIRSTALVQDLSRFMMGKLRFQENNGMTEARLTLTPEALGQVDVKLTMQNGQLIAQFSAHSALGKDALEAQMSQLRVALQNQGIQIERLEVTSSPVSFQSGMFQDQRRQQQSQQDNGQNASGRSQDGSEEYALEAAAILNGKRKSTEDGFDVTA